MPADVTSGCDDRDDVEYADCSDGGGPVDPPPEGCVADPEPEEPPQDFLRGDANTDGAISISDVLTIRRWLFNCDRAPVCRDAADSDDSGVVNITDAIFTLDRLHLGRPPFPAPQREAGPDPTDDGMGCFEYEVTPPAASGEFMEIGDVVAQPGETVGVPVLLTNSIDVEVFQLVLRFDPDVLLPIREIDPEAEPLGFEDGICAGELSRTPSYSTVRRQADDVLVVAFVPSSIHTGFEAPPGDGQRVFEIRVKISPDAEPGTRVELGPVDEPFGEYGLRSELAHPGEATWVSVIPEVAPGLLEIVGDLIIVRGDSNHDETVDIADGIHTLEWLFSRGAEPSCLDRPTRTTMGSST